MFVCVHMEVEVSYPIAFYLFMFPTIIYICVYVCVCACHTHIHSHSMCVKVKEQLTAVSSLLRPCMIQGSHSGLVAGTATHWIISLPYSLRHSLSQSMPGRLFSLNNESQRSSHLCSPRFWITGPQTWLSYGSYGSELRSSSFMGKHFTDWACSPAPLILFMISH